jgi:hypothetical protein
MRKLIVLIMVALSALVASPIQAADMPYYPPIEVPEVDYGLGGSFYLRGSVGANALWSKENVYYCPPPGCGVGTIFTEGSTDIGYGYSVGAGFGYETGDGIRADLTVDYLHNDGAAFRGRVTDGNKLILRSTIALANVYYDFGLGGMGGGSVGGGFGGYVGAGLGGAYNWIESRGTYTGYDPDGGSWSPAAALMTGVTYDMGSVVADLGYRMIYMPQFTNGQAAQGLAQGPYYINNNFIHEVRGTLRYRFN